MRTLLATLLLVLLTSAAASAQSYEELARKHGQPRSYHEAVVLTGEAQAALVVAFRIPNAMLVFVRSRPPAPGRGFVAEPQVTVLVYEGTRRVAEQTWGRQHYAATFEETQRNDVDLQGMLGFDLPPGTYTYRIRLKDPQADREGISGPRPVAVPATSSVHIGAALLAREAHTSAASARFTLVNLGGDAPFGEDAFAVLPLTLADGLTADGAVLRYVLRRLDDPEADPASGVVVEEGTLASDTWVPVRSGHEALLDEATVRWPVAVLPGAAAGYLAVLDLHGPRLEDAAYLLEATLAAGGASTTQQRRFSTHWRGKPYSLYQPTVALRNLRFVEDRQTLKALRDGSRRAQAAHLKAYWKERDPTPETPFNELMAEYYHRIDHAADAFRSGQSPAPDGLRTDRAAVYVVHGPPARTERTFPDDGGVEETWSYADGRRFVFWAATSLDPPQLQRRPER